MPFMNVYGNELLRHKELLLKSVSATTKWFRIVKVLAITEYRYARNHGICYCLIIIGAENANDTLRDRSYSHLALTLIHLNT